MEFTKICINDMMKPWQTSLNKTPNKRGREETKREYKRTEVQGQEKSKRPKGGH
jgi:hypothetical protein